jgi:hypothetical protein
MILRKNIRYFARDARDNPSKFKIHYNEREKAI